MNEYGKHIRESLRPYRSMRDAGLHHDLRAARWAESDRRIDAYLLLLAALATPIALYTLWHAI